MNDTKCPNCGRASEVVDMASCPFCHTKGQAAWERKLIVILQDAYTVGVRCDIYEPENCDACWKRQRILSYVSSLLTEATTQAKAEAYAEVLGEIEGMKANTPPYPMEGPNAEMITWAAKHAHFIALSDLSERITSKAKGELADGGKNNYAPHADHLSQRHTTASHADRYA